MTKSNKEVLSDGVLFTNNFYKNYRGGCSENEALSYSCDVLETVVTSPYDSWKTCFTRTNNLREDMHSLSKDAIINELLKMSVSLTAYNRRINSTGGSYLSTEIRTDLPDDMVAAAISNNVEMGNIEGLYSAMQDRRILASCVRSFVSVVSNTQKKEAVELVSQTDQRAVALNDRLDVHYARWKESNNSYGGYGGK